MAESSQDNTFTSMSRPAARVVNTKFSEDVDGQITRFDDTSNDGSQVSLPQSKTGEEDHIKLTWRSWLVVFVTCFAQLAQVFVVAGAGQNIAFIARDLGDASLAGWIIRENP